MVVIIKAIMARDIDKLEQIQKRAARFITGEYSKLTRITH